MPKRSSAIYRLNSPELVSTFSSCFPQLTLSLPGIIKQGYFKARLERKLIEAIGTTGVFGTYKFNRWIAQEGINPDTLDLREQQDLYLTDIFWNLYNICHVDKTHWQMAEDVGMIQDIGESKANFNRALRELATFAASEIVSMACKGKAISKISAKVNITRTRKITGGEIENLMKMGKDIDTVLKNNPQQLATVLKVDIISAGNKVFEHYLDEAIDNPHNMPAELFHADFNNALINGVWNGFDFITEFVPVVSQIKSISKIAFGFYAAYLDKELEDQKSWNYKLISENCRNNSVLVGNYLGRDIFTLIQAKDGDKMANLLRALRLIDRTGLHIQFS